jgi:hypothetical protein
MANFSERNEWLFKGMYKKKLRQFWSLFLCVFVRGGILACSAYGWLSYSYLPIVIGIWIYI